jgi:hypothetical protein
MHSHSIELAVTFLVKDKVIKMNKTAILSSLETSRSLMLELLEKFSHEQMVIPGVIGAWSMKDLLVHLTRWEAELIKLLWQAKRENQPTTLHFSQESTDAINERWFQESKNRDLNIVWQDFLTVRDQTIRRVKEFSDTELVKAGYFKWSQGKPLWEWIAADSYDHEAEHRENILAWQDNLDRN